MPKRREPSRNITIMDCISMYLKGYAAVISGGKVNGFVIEEGYGNHCVEKKKTMEAATSHGQKTKIL